MTRRLLSGFIHILLKASSNDVSTALHTLMLKALALRSRTRHSQSVIRESETSDQVDICPAVHRQNTYVRRSGILSWEPVQMKDAWHLCHLIAGSASSPTFGGMMGEVHTPHDAHSRKRQHQRHLFYPWLQSDQRYPALISVIPMHIVPRPAHQHKGFPTVMPFTEVVHSGCHFKWLRRDSRLCMKAKAVGSGRTLSRDGYGNSLKMIRHLFFNCFLQKSKELLKISYKLEKIKKNNYWWWSSYYWQSRMQQFLIFWQAYPCPPTSCSSRNQKWLLTRVSPSFPQQKIVSWPLRNACLLSGWKNQLLLGWVDLI